MKIVVAPDSFKGSLTAVQVGEAIRRGLLRAMPEAEVVVKPMADGGEGTLRCLLDATGGQLVRTTVKDPLGREIPADFGILGDGQTCVIEMAAASGLPLVEENRRNPLHTTTYGFGQLIRAGLDHGCRRFLLGLGGSATNDGGAGMLQALGFQLLDEQGEPIGFGGGELGRVARIETAGADPRLTACHFTVACDVSNPLVGPSGASHVFGPQKGATPEMVRQLDANLRHLANLMEKTTGVAVHDVPGAGAAGGVAGALLAFLRATLRPGIDMVMEAVRLEEAVCEADLVITGEGQVDAQTAQGKTPCGVAELAKRHHVPVIVLAGSIGSGIEWLYARGVTAVFSIVNGPMPLAEAMSRAPELLESVAEQVMRIYARRNFTSCQ